MLSDADASLLARLGSIDDSLRQVRDSIDSERDARIEETAAQRATAEALERKMTLANQAVATANAAHERVKVIAIVAAVASVIAIAASIAAVLALVRLQGVVNQRDAEARHDEIERVNQLVVNCINLNTARIDREARDEQLGGVVYDSLGEIIPPAPTPEAAAARQQLLDRGKAVFAERARASLPESLKPRDCSVEAVTKPSLISPPQPN